MNIYFRSSGRLLEGPNACAAENLRVQALITMEMG